MAHFDSGVSRVLSGFLITKGMRVPCVIQLPLPSTLIPVRSRSKCTKIEPLKP